jgi:hypothetical protein
MRKQGVLTISLKASPADYIALALEALARGDKALALACRDGCEETGSDRHVYAYVSLVEARFHDALHAAFTPCVYGCDAFPSADDKCSTCKDD